MTSVKEKLSTTSLLAQPPTRKNSGAASTMRKYQQLALAVVSVISLMAFLFYKHEYDRLRYTLEYLEMFGTSPIEMGQGAFCGGNTNRNLYTSPHLWVKLSDDVIVYSTFWDEQTGFSKPIIRTVALVKKMDMPPSMLQSKVLFESDLGSIGAVCSLEEVKKRRHAVVPDSPGDITVANIICEPEKTLRKVPYLTQFKIGNEDWSPPIFVQESQEWKSVPNITCACVYSTQESVSTLRLIEFVTHHSALGVSKFVFFGPVLTPLMRKLLDKYQDESNIFYEEKSFTLPKNFLLEQERVRILIEQDCLYRHKGLFENIIVLKLNEFIIPRTPNSLQEIMFLSRGGGTAAVSEYHFVSQKVCLDKIHSTDSAFLLNSQIRSLTINTDAGVSILRPHLLTGSLNFRVAGVIPEQHVSSANANVFSFETCNADSIHEEVDHLPTYARFVEIIKKSILYRKWKVNS